MEQTAAIQHETENQLVGDSTALSPIISQVEVGYLECVGDAAGAASCLLSLRHDVKIGQEKESTGGKDASYSLTTEVML